MGVDRHQHGDRRPGRVPAALPGHPGRAGRVGRDLSAAVPSAHRAAPVEHGLPDRGGDRRLRRSSAPRAAFAVERTAVPLRRLWSVLVVIPLAIPDFVVGYAWVSITPDLHGLWGASLVMTLALYPLVYLPVAASLRRTDPALEEAARSLGAGRLETFRRVTLRQIRPGLLGGCLVVALALLAEFGAFEILRFQTFTTTIYAEAQVGFNSPAACALSLVLVGLGLLVILGEVLLNRRSRLSRVGPQASRPPSRPRLGWAAWPVLAALVALVGLALGVPLGALVYWLTHSQASTLPGISVARRPPDRPRRYAAAAAAVTTAAAIPIALLAVRHRSRVGMVIERSIYLVQCLPGAGHRPEPGVLLDPLPLPLLPDTRAAGGRVHDPVLPPGPDLRAGLGGPGARRAPGDGALARGGSPPGLRPGHPAPHRPRTGRRLLPGLPVRRDRADRHPDPHPHRHPDAGHPVLGLPDQRLLRGGRPLRGHAGGHRRRAQLRAGPVVRPAQRRQRALATADRAPMAPGSAVIAGVPPEPTP